MRFNLTLRSEQRGCRWASSKGANLVETAMVIPLLFLLTFAIMDFATLFYAYLALENGVSQATRYAVTGQFANDPDPTLRAQAIRTAMRQATPTLTISDGAFNFYNVTKAASGTGGPNDIIRVTVNYGWTASTPLIRPFFTNGQIQLSVSSTMKNEPFPSS